MGTRQTDRGIGVITTTITSTTTTTTTHRTSSSTSLVVDSFLDDFNREWNVSRGQPAVRSLRTAFENGDVHVLYSYDSVVEYTKFQIHDGNPHVYLPIFHYNPLRHLRHTGSRYM